VWCAGTGPVATPILGSGQGLDSKNLPPHIIASPSWINEVELLYAFTHGSPRAPPLPVGVKTKTHVALKPIQVHEFKISVRCE
jgi:hypothetical protein